MFVVIAVFPKNIATADNEDPFRDPSRGADDKSPDESKPRVITEAGKKTLDILRAEKFDAIVFDLAEQQKGFDQLKIKLAKRGVTMRLKHVPRASKPNYKAGENVLSLRDIPLDKFMQYLDHWAGWGWILYPDGSITYFDSQCCGSWPKDGLYCHDSQYEAGKPEVMEREQKAAAEKQKKQNKP